MKKNLAPFITLALLLVACCLYSSDFRSSYNLMNIARQVSYSGLLALGMTLVIAGGGIDLSVGSLLALSGVLGLQVMNALPAGTPDGLAFAAMASVALLVGVVGGLLNGALVNYGRIPPFIATLGTFSIFRSIAVFRANASLVQSSNKMLNSIARGCGGTLPLIILLLVAALLFCVLRFTRFGWRICAVGANEKAATYASVNVGLVRFLSYALIGLLCGLGAILLASRLQSISSTGAGNAYELDAIACVIIGGTPMTGGRASIWGTLAGVFILGIIGNVLDLWSISAYLQGTVKGIIIIMAVLLQYKASLERRR
jgi:ribose transport system permease protein